MEWAEREKMNLLSSRPAADEDEMKRMQRNVVIVAIDEHTTICVCVCVMGERDGFWFVSL